MAVAREVARRATCPRAQVGCVLTAGGVILATGLATGRHQNKRTAQTWAA